MKISPMKKCLLLLATLLPMAAHSGWVSPNGKPIPETASMRSAGNFGVQLILTGDQDKFRQVWNSSKTPPTLSTIDSVRLGGEFSALLILHGCTPDARGLCNVDSEFILEAPDGSRTPMEHSPVWTEKSAPPRLLLLGRNSMTVQFDQADPPGIYKVIANVKDQVSGQTLSVSSRLKVTK